MCQSDGGEARLGFSMSDIGTYYASVFSLCMKFFKNNYKIWVKSMNYTPQQFLTPVYKSVFPP